MQNLTEQQKKNLGLAIDAAKDSGGCRYEKGGEPRCVIAQLAHIEGVPLAEMKRWDKGDGFGILGVNRVLQRVEDADPGKLAEYPADLLIQLQAIWDRGFTVADPAYYGSTDAERRVGMKRCIDQWEADHAEVQKAA